MNHVQPTPERHTVFLTFKTDVDMVKALKEYAKQHGLPVSDVVRNCLKKFISKYNRDTGTTW